MNGSRRAYAGTTYPPVCGIPALEPPASFVNSVDASSIQLQKLCIYLLWLSILQRKLFHIKEKVGLEHHYSLAAPRLSTQSWGLFFIKPRPGDMTTESGKWEGQHPFQINQSPLPFLGCHQPNECTSSLSFLRELFSIPVKFVFLNTHQAFPPINKSAPLITVTANGVSLPHSLYAIHS